MPQRRRTPGSRFERRFVPGALPRLLWSFALAGSWPASSTLGAEPSSLRPQVLEARFRGCESAGWCRFSIAPSDPSSESLYRVRPAGIPPVWGDERRSAAVRDRLNALLADMIHQHKRIVLRDLRELGDGTYAATVLVNGANVAQDPVLAELREPVPGANR